MSVNNLKPYDIQLFIEMSLKKDEKIDEIELFLVTYSLFI